MTLVSGPFQIRCFDIKLQEPPCLDGAHPATEDVDWMVIESGSWSGDEGHMIQAGLLEIEGDRRVSGEQFHTVAFLTAFPTLPVVLSQCMTYFGSNFVKTRQQQLDSRSFQVALEEIGSAQDSQQHTNFEKVGWFAIEPGQGNIGTRDFQASLTPEAVTHELYDITFAGHFAVEPRFFGGMQTYFGTDSSQLRHSGVNTRGARVFVEEETCSDDEVNHAREIVGYFALEPGTAASAHNDSDQAIIWAQDNLNRGCEGVYDATTAVLVNAQFESGNPAERACTEAVCHNQERIAGTIGTGAIDFVTRANDTATWHVKACTAGHYYIVFGYALGGGSDRCAAPTHLTTFPLPRPGIAFCCRLTLPPPAATQADGCVGQRRGRRPVYVYACDRKLGIVL